MKNWRVKAENTFDCEFGFSCMGYEIPAGWGAAMADPTRTPIVMVGDGTYMMMNSDIYSSVLAGHKFILIVCDNGGYAVINRLQIGKGAAAFNNLIRDCRVKEPFAVDFAKHAEMHGRADAQGREPRRPRPSAWTGPRPPTAPRSSPSCPTPSAGARATRGGTSACPRSATARRSTRRACRPGGEAQGPARRGVTGRGRACDPRLGDDDTGARIKGSRVEMSSSWPPTKCQRSPWPRNPRHPSCRRRITRR